MADVLVIAGRELRSYFATPLALVFLVVFLALSGALAVFLGGLFDRGQAELTAFFGYHPWLYLLLVPALSMRLWAEERRSGTIELLLTLPVGLPALVVGKFLAAWAVAGIALALTFPAWVTVAYLGDPDHGVIVAAYLGSLLMAGSYMAIGACISALTRNQVVAFILSAAVCFLFTAGGIELVLGLLKGHAPGAMIDAVAAMSFLPRFQSIARGVVEARDVVFFASLIGFFLTANVVALDLRRAS